MTSNLGSDLLLNALERKHDLTKEELLEVLEPVLKATFRPEFLNRLDEVLPFVPLRLEDMEKIVDLQLETVASRLKERSISFEWDRKAAKYLAEKGYDPVFGARPLKRLIQNEVINLFSSAILEEKILPHSHLILTESQKHLHYNIPGALTLQH